MALTKMVKASMKMMREALPKTMISFLTTFCPTRAATVATMTKYIAAITIIRKNKPSSL